MWSSLGVVVVLLAAALEENVLRQWRRVQAEVAASDGPFSTGIRQIVGTTGGTVDRCTTCHIGMDPAERLIGLHRLARPHPPVPHDLGEFGCTVCHGGQGRATESADAHGDVPFWPEPLIPLRFVEAGCGTCHTQIGVPTLERLAQGQAVLERSDCLSCHRLDGRGGTIRPAGVGGMEGPDLSVIGRRGFASDWYQVHQRRARENKDPVWRDCIPDLSAEERQLLEEYLQTRVGTPNVVAGQALFHSLGCRGCHKVSGVGGTEGPDLTAIGLRDPARLDFTNVQGPHTLANWLSAHTRDPAKIVPGSKMPKLLLSDAQVESLTYYLLSLRSDPSNKLPEPIDRTLVERMQRRQFATDGETLFAAFCSGCHGPQGEGRRFPGHPPAPAVGNPDFLAVADDAFLLATIRDGRPGRRMPAFSEAEVGLHPEEIDSIVEYLRARSGVPSPQPLHSEQRWVSADTTRGQALFERWCAGCHGKDGSGPEAPALNHPNLLQTASDDFLVETIRRGRRGTNMEGFASPSLNHPVLSDQEIEAIVAYIRTWETAK
ncbi:c-type cytochrome [Thermogutta sp.]|uniref:c-type cytochrome n=1 Tax=Thermogutta sp. TaxID=1962930 RepID=UPI0032201778